MDKRYTVAELSRELHLTPPEVRAVVVDLEPYSDDGRVKYDMEEVLDALAERSRLKRRHKAVEAATKAAAKAAIAPKPAPARERVEVVPPSLSMEDAKRILKENGVKLNNILTLRRLKNGAIGGLERKSKGADRFVAVYPPDRFWSKSKAGFK